MDSEVLRRFITKNYIKCFQENARKSSLKSNFTEELTCPWVFDGYLCWPETTVNTVAQQDCPDFVEGFDATRQAHKTCEGNGSWYRHPNTNLEWSNYTNCVDHDEFDFRSVINNWYIRGYTISLAALIISLMIFACFKSLWCTRIKIHIQLFISLSFTCVVWIIWYKFFIQNTENFYKYPVSHYEI